MNPKPEKFYYFGLPSTSNSLLKRCIEHRIFYNEMTFCVFTALSHFILQKPKFFRLLFGRSPAKSDRSQLRPENRRLPTKLVPRWPQQRGSHFSIHSRFALEPEMKARHMQQRGLYAADVMWNFAFKANFTQKFRSSREAASLHTMCRFHLNWFSRTWSGNKRDDI